MLCRDSSLRLACHHHHLACCFCLLPVLLLAACCLLPATCCLLLAAWVHTNVPLVHWLSPGGVDRIPHAPLLLCSSLLCPASASTRKSQTWVHTASRGLRRTTRTRGCRSNTFASSPFNVSRRHGRRCSAATTPAGSPTSKRRPWRRRASAQVTRGRERTQSTESLPWAAGRGLSFLQSKPSLLKRCSLTLYHSFFHLAPSHRPAPLPTAALAPPLPSPTTARAAANGEARSEISRPGGDMAPLLRGLGPRVWSMGRDGWRGAAGGGGGANCPPRRGSAAY